MSYELSFSQDFFGYGEEKRDKKGRPMNLWTAVLDYVRKERRADHKKELAELVEFQGDIDTMAGDMFVWKLIDRAVIINTCSNLNTPVEVWLDEEGYNTVEVY